MPRVARATSLTLLGSDHDHAVGCIRSVQRRRRRSLHDLDVRDLFRVEDVQHAHRRTARAHADGRRVHADAVDDVDRLTAERDGLDAANADGGCGTRHVAGQHHDAWRLGDHEVGQVGDWRGFDLVADVAKSLDRVAQLHPALLTGGRRDDFRELHDGLVHREVDRHRGASGDRDRLLHFGVTHADDANFELTRRGAERIPPIRVRAGHDVRADEIHAAFRERLAAVHRADLTCNGCLLLRKSQRRGAEPNYNRECETQARTGIARPKQWHKSLPRRKVSERLQLSAPQNPDWMRLQLRGANASAKDHRRVDDRLRGTAANSTARGTRRVLRPAGVRWRTPDRQQRFRFRDRPAARDVTNITLENAQQSHPTVCGKPVPRDNCPMAFRTKWR